MHNGTSGRHACLMRMPSVVSTAIRVVHDVDGVRDRLQIRRE
ncbi:hypothetical protein BLA50215_00482 [Burkholderia lata]|nr:hypothetical protein BLA50215_00482 [Burkholderia lata]